MPEALSDGLLTSLLYAGFVLVAGGLAGASSRGSFRPAWLLAAAAYFFVYDLLLSRGYGVLPNPDGASWNWVGKALAIGFTLGVMALPSVGFQRAGVTLRQQPGAVWAWGVFAAIAAVLAYLAMGDGYVEPDLETRLFQWTMPGLDEELAYRGVLLLLLNEALRGRVNLLGTRMGWGALITSLLFGAIHTVSISGGSLELDWPITQTIGAFVLVWMRERTGSLLLPVLAHNYVNGIFLVV